MRSNRYGDQRQNLTSVADTAVQIVSPTKRFFLITGAASQYWLVLPDARTIRLGTPFVFENTSSEFVGVRNSDSTTWERVPPRWGITCVLVSQATAAGVWSVTWQPNPMAKNGGLQVTDFSGGTYSASTYYAEAGWLAAVSGGANATAALVGPNGVVGQLATTVAQYAELYNCRYFSLGSGPCRYKYRVSRSAANAAVDEFTTRYGLGSNILGGAHVDGCYFLNDFTTYGNVWVTRTIAAAGGNTTNPTADVPAVYPNWDSLSLEVSAAGTRVDFFVGTNLRFSHIVAANIPGSAVAVANTMMIVKVANATARYSYVDYVEAGVYPTVQR